MKARRTVARAGRDDGVMVRVRLTPRAGRDAVDGVDASGMLRARVAAPPAEGAANQSLIKLLARELHVPATSIEIVGGASSREKRLRIGRLAGAALEARWPGSTTGGEAGE